MASSSKKSATKGKRGPKDGFESKQILKKHKETTNVFADSLQQIEGRIELLETKCDQANFIPVKEAALRNNRRLLAYLSPQIKISDIINFFEDVGQVVCVQLVINQLCQQTSIGMVEFASANEAKKALEKKNGSYLCGNKIALCLVVTFLPKYCIAHKVWYQESFLAPLPASPRVVKHVIFVANLSPQTNTLHLNFFEYDVREAVSVRLIVNCEGKHVGYGFVEFASVRSAEKALEKNGEYLQDHKIFLVAVTASSPRRPKYNLSEMLCYEDHIRRENLLIEDETVERHYETPDFLEAVAIRKKTLVVSNFSCRTEISHIINFFKDVGEVVHVRLSVDHTGMHEGYGFVEFASAYQAEKALKKNGEYLHDRMIFLEPAEIARSPPPTHFIDHHVWYEDYLGREGLLTEEEDKTVEDLFEEIAVMKKTIFVCNLSWKITMPTIINFFIDVGQVVRIRLIGNDMGEHLFCGFVEFASTNQAKKALEKDGERLRDIPVTIDVVRRAPYPLQLKYNLAEKLWYEDYLRREGLPVENDFATKRKKQYYMGVFCGTTVQRPFGTKTTFDEGRPIEEDDDLETNWK